MKRTWKTQLKQGTCISLATLMLISPNGVINVKAADIETGKQQSANSSSDKIDAVTAPPADAQRLSAVPQKSQYAQWHNMHFVHIVP